MSSASSNSIHSLQTQSYGHLALPSQELRDFQVHHTAFSGTVLLRQPGYLPTPGPSDPNKGIDRTYTVASGRK